MTKQRKRSAEPTTEPDAATADTEPAAEATPAPQERLPAASGVMPGWYIARDGKPLHGPFPSPEAATQRAVELRRAGMSADGLALLEV